MGIRHDKTRSDWDAGREQTKHHQRGIFVVEYKDQWPGAVKNICSECCLTKAIDKSITNRKRNLLGSGRECATGMSDSIPFTTFGFGYQK